MVTLLIDGAILLIDAGGRSLSMRARRSASYIHVTVIVNYYEFYYYTVLIVLIIGGETST